MLENFKILREIDSLMRKTEDHEKLILKENNRIQKVKDQLLNRKKQKEEDMESLKSISLEITSLENDLNLNINKQEKKNSQKASVFTEAQVSALNNELQKIESTIENLEINVLEKMELKESLIESIEDAKSFEKGAKESLEEIEKEVNSTLQDEKKKILTLQKRIENLKENLALDFKNKLDNVLNKKLRTTSLAKIEHKCCHYCKMQIDSIKINSVEDKHQLQTCSQCSRILMPSSSFY